MHCMQPVFSYFIWFSNYLVSICYLKGILTDNEDSKCIRQNDCLEDVNILSKEVDMRLDTWVLSGGIDEELGPPDTGKARTVVGKSV